MGIKPRAAKPNCQRSVPLKNEFERMNGKLRPKNDIFTTNTECRYENIATSNNLHPSSVEIVLMSHSVAN